MTILHADFAVPGDTAGTLCLLSEPLSLWGGYDVATGSVADPNHAEHGQILAGKVVAMREACGSSSSSSTLVESARCGTAPLAIILQRVDPILVMGSLVAADLYGISIPIVVLAPSAWPSLVDNSRVRVSAEKSAVVIDRIY